MAEWVRALAWNSDQTFPAGFEPHFGEKLFATELWQFRLPLFATCLSDETLKAVRSLLSGVYARGSKISHQSALECVTVVDSCPALIKEEEVFFQK